MTCEYSPECTSADQDLRTVVKVSYSSSKSYKCLPLQRKVLHKAQVRIEVNISMKPDRKESNAITVLNDAL